MDHAAAGQPIRLRDYELLELLGQGGMGAVYKARHLRLSVGKVIFSAKGNWLLTAGYDHRIALWDLETGRHEDFRGHEDTVSGIAFTPDGRHILSASQDGSAQLWDAIRIKSEYTFAAHGGPVRDIVCTPDGRYAITTGDDLKLRVWRLPLEGPPGVPDYLSSK